MKHQLKKKIEWKTTVKEEQWESMRRKAKPVKHTRSHKESFWITNENPNTIQKETYKQKQGAAIQKAMNWNQPKAFKKRMNDQWT